MSIWQRIFQGIISRWLFYVLELSSFFRKGIFSFGNIFENFFFQKNLLIYWIFVDKYSNFCSNYSAEYLAKTECTFGRIIRPNTSAEPSVLFGFGRPLNQRVRIKNIKMIWTVEHSAITIVVIIVVLLLKCSRFSEMLFYLNREWWTKIDIPWGITLHKIV